MIPTTGRRHALYLLLVSVPALLLCLSGVASAHVTVQPGTAAAGSESVFTFRVPSEKARASTVKVLVALPTGPAIPVVSLQPVPGWAAGVTTRKLSPPVQTDDGRVGRAVSRITWTADGRADAIAPDEFQEFTIEAGPLPKTRRLVFKVLQYYSDGSVVRWIDPPALGGEPDHPAPTVTLVAGPSPSAAANAPSRPASTDRGDGWIAVSALVAGLLGLATGTAALVVARRSGTDDPS